MAGHSKWANIKHRKGAQDAKRGQAFTKIIREITVAARSGAQPESNPRLRAAIDRGLGVNMSKDTIAKAIQKGAGLNAESQLEEVTYEGYGPCGVAFLLLCATDNKQRTVADIRHYFTKAGGSLGQTGSVSYQFETLGLITFSSNNDPDELFQWVIEAGCDDFEFEDNDYTLQCAHQNIYSIAEFLREKGLCLTNISIERKPTVFVQGDSECEEKITSLCEKFDNHDDVQQVFCNYSFSE